MNSLSNDAAEELTPIVEAFLYHDTLPRGTADLSGLGVAQPGEAKTANSNKASRSQEETSRLVHEARAEGLAQGLQQAAARYEEDLAQERKRVTDSILEFQRQRAEYYSKVEIELVHLALAVVAKILHRESQIDRMVVAGLVKVMLERLQQNTKVVVRVRPEDAKDWTHYFRDNANLQIVADATLEPKACLLETELGVANMALDAQLKEVEQGFFDLLAQRPDPIRPDAK
ncbi:MAG: FliH/SctL family protein [Terriglobales bacterium]